MLTKQQVGKVIYAPKNLKHQLMLMTAYSAGLRAGEVTRLKVEDIDSKRMLIKVVNGKGRKDRYTMLSAKLLDDLRGYYQRYRLQSNLFPSVFKQNKVL